MQQSNFLKSSSSSNKTSFLYSLFLFKIIIRKKNSIIIPLIMIVFNILATSLISTLIKTPSQLSITIYFLVFIQLLFSIIFASIKAINVFNDIEKEGIELLVFSKKITRRKIIFSKIIFFIVIISLWSVLILLNNLVIYLINESLFSQIDNFILYSFVVPFFASLIFGFITSLISVKFSSKVALTLPLLIFTPLILLGSFLNSSVTSVPNNVAKILNQKYDNYDGGTIANTNNFYLNNQKDQFFIIPKNLGTQAFEQRQKDFIEDAFAISKNSTRDYQIYSWLSLPYQMVDIFNRKDKDVLENIFGLKESNLQNYLFYNGLDSKLNNYQINKSPELLKLNVGSGNTTENSYIVPGAFKNASIFENLTNREIIYARENAGNFDVEFLEDSYTFATPNNLVGKLNSKILEQALQSLVFQKKANEFYQNLDPKLDKAAILKAISDLIDEEGGNLVSLVDDQTTLFNTNIDTTKISHMTEKKVYLAIALIYHLYFHNNNSSILKTLLKNDKKELNYQPSQIDIKIKGNVYKIGGYASYTPVQQVINNKIIYRYQLNKSTNFLFQTTTEAYSVEFSNKVVEKNFYSLIWAILALGLASLNYLVYSKKDYK